MTTPDEPNADGEGDDDPASKVVVFEGHRGVGFGIGPVPRRVREQRQREREAARRRSSSQDG